MARDDSPPWARGETFYNGGEIDPNDTLGLGGINYEGKEFLFEVNAQDQGTGYPAGQDPSGRPIRVKIVRNSSGQALKGSRIAHFSQGATQTIPYETAVDGYCTSPADRPAGVIDEFLPPAGVPSNDLFYLVIDGPTQFTNTTSASTIAVGDRLEIATAGATVGDDLGGRVVTATFAGATLPLANQIQNQLGFAGVSQANTVSNGTIVGVAHLFSKW